MALPAGGRKEGCFKLHFRMASFSSRFVSEEKEKNVLERGSRTDAPVKRS